MNEDHTTVLTQTTMERKEYDVPLQDTIQSRFEAFDKANPKIWELYKKYALELHAARPGKHYGIAAITERIRWHVAVETTGMEFKINNSYRSRYARKLAAEFPQLVGMFRSRDLRTA